jgi:integrase
MPTAKKLTEKIVARLPAPDPSGKQRLYWDPDLKVFGVLCSGATTAKTYVVQRAVKGVSRRVTIGPANVLTLADAKKRAEPILSLFFSGVDPKAKNSKSATLAATLAAYLEARAGLKPRSKASYRETVERHLRGWLTKPLSTITRDMVEARHRQIAEEIVTMTGRHSGQATANAVMRSLRLLWNYAADRDASLGPNPVRLRKQWFDVPRREGLVKANDLPAFYAAVIGLSNTVARDYLLLLLFTGLRRREAASLRWADVDLAGRVIRIPAARTKAGRKLDLPMSDVVRNLMVARRAIGDGRFVFMANSKSGHIEEPKFALQDVAAACGVKVTVHDLRRTFITVAESCDISPLALKALANHATGNDVTAGYVQMTTERLREPAQKVADKLKELCGIAEAAGDNVARLR